METGLGEGRVRTSMRPWPLLEETAEYEAAGYEGESEDEEPFVDDEEGLVVDFS